jgi:hypothetical protein
MLLKYSWTNVSLLSIQLEPPESLILQKPTNISICITVAAYSRSNIAVMLERSSKDEGMEYSRLAQ